jgi:DNA-binding beta-propeller fold protein YncE
MKLTDAYHGGAQPFEGDAHLIWTSLPRDAKVTSARVTLTPVPPPDGVLFVEHIAIPGATGDWGTTVVTGSITVGAAARPFVEIDFHKRRTLASVTHAGLTNASLQIDMGGVYVEINSQGAILTPSNPTAFALPADGTLPGLTVSKFRLIATAATPAAVSRVAVRSVPSNVTVRVGKMGPFWSRVGDLVAADTSPDFADVLQAFLTSAPVVNGFFEVPIVVHSDTVARLTVGLDVELVREVSLTPEGVDEVVLPFDFSTRADAQPGVLGAALPAGGRVVPVGATGSVVGAFSESRVVFGPTGEDRVAGVVSIAAAETSARMFMTTAPLSVGAIDLLMAAAPPAATLAVDVRRDLDGKPDPVSVIGAAVEADVDGKPDGRPRWVSIPLDEPLKLKENTTYWLVVQSIQGSAVWSAEGAGAWQSRETSLPSSAMQRTQDGGLSWRSTPEVRDAGALAGLFRLRAVPSKFEVPIELQVGVGASALRIGLDRFQPMGRVDFSLDIPEVAAGLDDCVAALPAGCSDAEHLANASFQEWALVGDRLGKASPIALMPGTRHRAVAVSKDGRTAFAGVTLNGNDQSALVLIDVACNRALLPPLFLNTTDTPASIVPYPDGTKVLVLGNRTLTLMDLQRPDETVSVQLPVSALAMSLDGTTVYLVVTDENESGLAIVPTATLEHFLRQPGGSFRAATMIPMPGRAVALAVDRQRVCVLCGIDDAGTTRADVVFVNPGTAEIEGDPLPVGSGPLTFGVTPDGSRMLAINSNSAPVLISPSSRHVLGLAVTLSDRISAIVALSADGRRAYVATATDSGDGSLVVLDLTAKTVVESLPTPLAITAMAITPQGDELYEISVRSPLSHIPIGRREPADWFVTSGEVGVSCMPEISSAHVIAFFNAEQQAAALSQVVPIAGGCRYDFAFEGLTDDPNAVAEVLWRDDGCKGVKTDSVPVPLKASGKRRKQTPPVGAITTPASPRERLVHARARLDAPPGAVSAEVRFVTPDGHAIIAGPSLKGNPDVLFDAELQSGGKPGLSDRWTLLSGAPDDVLASSDTGAVLLRNTAADAVDLVRQTDLTAGEKLTLDFRGRVVSTGGGDKPTVELHWLTAVGGEAAAPVVASIGAGSFDSHPITATSPAGTERVQVRLHLPAGSALAVEDLSLRVERTTTVPVSFIAQSPGELRIRSARVRYDTAASEAAPVPAAGLCPPTAPGQSPGPATDHSCFCSSCGGQQKMVKPSPGRTASGRPLVVGRCARCGDQVTRGGGRAAGAVERLRTRVVHDHPVRPPASAGRRAPALTLVQVLGIGESRARKLKRAGIRTVRELAAAEPQQVADALERFSTENAAVLIAHARALLEEHLVRDPRRGSH